MVHHDGSGWVRVVDQQIFEQVGRSRLTLIMDWVGAGIKRNDPCINIPQCSLLANFVFKASEVESLISGSFCFAASCLN